MSILFCTPCYGGKADAPHMRSNIALARDLTSAGIDFDFCIRSNESLVHRARMGMTKSFLDSKFSHMMWLDSDIEFEAEDVGKLWNLNTDIAVGFYAMKRDDMPLSAWKDGKLLRIENCPDEPFSPDLAGTGFMLISKDAVVRIIMYLEQREKAYLAIIEKLEEPERKFMREFTPWAEYENETKNIPAIYMTPIHQGILESEDYHFCRMAREAGLQIIGDPSIKLGHYGTTRYGA